MMRNVLKYGVVLLLIILIDQSLKLWVYYHMDLGPPGSIKLLGNYFKLTYVHNNGMAFGLQFGFKYGKLWITLVRIVASVSIALSIRKILIASKEAIWVWGWVLVLGGAVGNSIDGIFYGVYLNNAAHGAPMQWFHGQVIDMLHMDIWSGILPCWLPFIGGYEVCMLPIFNVADVAIFAGLWLRVYAHICKQSVVA